jgi:hypothetical protein
MRPPWLRRDEVYQAARDTAIWNSDVSVRRRSSTPIGVRRWPPSLASRALTPAEKLKLNANRVGVVGGGPGGRYVRIAHDLGLVLDDNIGYSMRVVAHTGRGSVRNILDLLYLEHVDIAIVQSDVLDSVARDLPPDLILI